MYVDDIFIMPNNEKQQTATKKKLKENFKTKEFGEVNHILGLRVARDQRSGKIAIDEAAYISEILERFKMSDCNLESTPLDVNQKWYEIPKAATPEEEDEMSKIPYQEAVGALFCVSQTTRPDIAHAKSVK